MMQTWQSHSFERHSRDYYVHSNQNKKQQGVWSQVRDDGRLIVNDPQLQANHRLDQMLSAFGDRKHAIINTDDD